MVFWFFFKLIATPVMLVPLTFTFNSGKYNSKFIENMWFHKATYTEYSLIYQMNQITDSYHFTSPDWNRSLLSVFGSIAKYNLSLGTFRERKRNNSNLIFTCFLSIDCSFLLKMIFKCNVVIFLWIIQIYFFNNV